MSVMLWMARRFAIGGTARWAAKLYKYYSVENDSIEETMKAMLFTRYKATGQLKSKGHILKKINQLIDKSVICDLHSLSLFIISEESKHFFDTPDETQIKWSEIVFDELRKSSLPEEVIGDPEELGHDYELDLLVIYRDEDF